MPKGLVAIVREQAFISFVDFVKALAHRLMEHQLSEYSELYFKGKFQQGRLLQVSLGASASHWICYHQTCPAWSSCAALFDQLICSYTQRESKSYGLVTLSLMH